MPNLREAVIAAFEDVPCAFRLSRDGRRAIVRYTKHRISTVNHFFSKLHLLSDSDVFYIYSIYEREVPDLCQSLDYQCAIQISSEKSEDII